MKAYTLYLKITAMLLAVAVLSLGVTVLTAPKTETAASDSLRLAASFYPVYITTLNLTQGVDDVTVDCLVKEQVGCLHDYQMSPRERRLLESAQVLILNGAGAEAALVASVGEVENVVDHVVDLSDGIACLAAEHEHGEHEHEHDHEDDAKNSHVWVSVSHYRTQVENLCEALCDIDPDHARQYRTNAAVYLEKIDAVQQRLTAALAPYADVPTVAVHDSLAYLAQEAALPTVLLNVGENQVASPDKLAQATDLLEEAPRALFLCDAQYDNRSYADLQTIPEKAIVVSVDTCVKGEFHPDRWLEAMTTLCEDLEAAA